MFRVLGLIGFISYFGVLVKEFSLSIYKGFFKGSTRV